VPTRTDPFDLATGVVSAAVVAAVLSRVALEREPTRATLGRLARAPLFVPYLLYAAVRANLAMAVVVFALLVGVGLFVLIDDENLLEKVVGLNVFQTGVILFFVTSAYRADGRAPLVAGEGPFVNPLPHVLVLTAIVVGVSVTAVALALIVRLYDEYGTVRLDVIRDARAEAATAGPESTDGDATGGST
jgi:multicomponent Na+:H+ antiporter subunit C